MGSSTAGRGRKVLVLMATYNAGRFIAEQLSSLASQSWLHIDVLVSDDGSVDGTIAHLEASKAAWTKGTFSLTTGPRGGFAENFRSLIARFDGGADYVAFSDQDDVWDNDKLDRAIAWLDRQEPGRPALYCGRTRLIDENGRPIGFSPLFRKPVSFRNALVQSIAGANTMVLNKAAALVVAEASRRTPFISHDWWCYMLVSGAGGAVHYSPIPAISYRQHDGNLVGANSSFNASLNRLRALLFTSRFSNWNTANLAALSSAGNFLNQEAIKVQREFEKARALPVLGRLKALRRSGVYRQTAKGQLGLWLACVLRRI